MSGFTPLQAPWLQGGGNSLGSNPLAMIGEVMKLRQGQQEWNARQQLGNIFAGSPDMDTALERARQDPLVSQFPQFMTELRNQRLLDTQTQQAQLGQANSAREAVQHSVLEAGNDPDALLPAMQRQISSLNYLPKNVQQQMLAHAQTLAENLTHGQDKMSPEERSADYVKKRAQFLVSQGMKPEEAYAAGGGTFMSPQVVETTNPDGSVSKRVVGGPNNVGSTLSTGPTPYLSPQVVEVKNPDGSVTQKIMGGPGSLGQTAPAGGGVTLGTGQTPGQKGFQERQATDMADYQKNLNNSVSSGMTLMNTVEEARDALNKIKTGGGAEVYRTAGKIAQALGGSQDLVDRINGGDAGSVDEFQKLAATMAMGQLKQQLPQGSMANRNEWNAFASSNPNLETDPRAIEKMFNFWTRLHTRDRIEQSQMREFIADGHDPAGWPAEWANRASKMGLVNQTFRVMGPGGKRIEVQPEAVKMLLDDPGSADHFDAVFGKGAAATFLGQSRSK